MAKVKKITPPSFDLNKNYRWEPTDEFTLSGNDYSVLFHALKMSTQTPTGAPAQTMVDAYQVLLNLLKAGVEAGIVKEIVVEVQN
jgi:hypothetical protein